MGDVGEAQPGPSRGGLWGGGSGEAQPGPSHGGMWGGGPQPSTVIAHNKFKNFEIRRLINFPALTIVQLKLQGGSIHNSHISVMSDDGFSDLVERMMQSNKELMSEGSLTQNHYYGIINLKVFLGVKYMCDYSHHSCSARCGVCEGEGCVRGRDCSVLCSYCHKICFSPQCFDRHKHPRIALKKIVGSVCAIQT